MNATIILTLTYISSIAVAFVYLLSVGPYNSERSGREIARSKLVKGISSGLFVLLLGVGAYYMSILGASLSPEAYIGSLIMLFFAIVLGVVLVVCLLMSFGWLHGITQEIRTTIKEAFSKDDH
jgi:protein-S-isoprenylcysteine O-methyltransferase Ste14